MLQMSDVEEDGAADPREELAKLHRKQKKDLQAQIQALKKTASKGDKKKKKEVTETITQLEADLEARHKAELEQLDSEAQPISNGQDSVAVDALPNGVVRRGEDSDDGALGPLPMKEGNTNNVSKAQKRRDKKAAKEKERLEEIEKQEELNRSGPRVQEQESIRTKLVERQLKLKDIPSDGDCMFAGLVHQLSLLGVDASVSQLRQETAQELQAHADDYVPFLTNESGDMMSEVEFAAYCDAMRNTVLPTILVQVNIKTNYISERGN